MTSALSLKNINRSFVQGHKKIDVLKGINLEVKQGELVALLGSSGSGKSTLLQIAGLLDSEFKGSLEIGGAAVEAKSDDMRSALRREKLGFIYQFHHLLPDFSALENVAMGLRVAGVGAKEASKKAEELLARLGLAERLDHLPSKLSGGEQQRVAIARAVATDPVLLLADEPTGNLDEETADRVLTLLLETVRERGLAAVIATHDKKLAEKLDRKVYLHDGMLTPA
ncbi:ABC transporter ATP-binding protein [Kordiimonas laminariae]|uniref:ABC transporter ATP-binding protein n=1 Tax=Kordiimonas laminariae TaxID=2917717 RepID=UPI001FF1B424|nr:ABC transporter ATP-binding protein [Kordiimonas laminariae]MCK0071007.1 ABC transporter ATP-binding protein [Kordiimonas laminariae]